MKLKDLINKRKGLIEKLNALVNAAKTDGRDMMSEEENSQWEDLNNQIISLDAEIERAQRMNALEEQQAQHTRWLETVPGQRADGSLGGDQGGGDGGLEARTAQQRMEEAFGLARLSRQEYADLQGYSFVRAFRSFSIGGQLTGIEAEMHQEAVRNARHNGQDVAGVGVPQIVMAFAGGAHRFRDDLTAETATEGVETIQTTLQPLIDILYKRLALRRMGASFLTDLTGNIAFPRAAAGTDPANKDENAASDETSPTFTQLSLSPERLPVHAEVSTQLLMQSSIGVEAWLRNHLATLLSVLMDEQGVNGSGASHQPQGIIGTAGIGTVNTNSDGNTADKPTYEDMVDLETKIGEANADVDTMGYLTSARMRGQMKKTQIFAGTSGMPVWTGSADNGEMNGYRALASNVVPDDLTKGTATALSAFIFGNFADLIMAQWGGLNLLANPFSLDTQGLVRLSAAAYFDVGVRQAGSFAVVPDAATVDGKTT